MKVKIIFKLPEDDREHKLAIDSEKLFSALWDVSLYLRKITKYSDEEEIKREIVKNMFYEILEENDINLDNYQ